MQTAEGEMLANSQADVHHSQNSIESSHICEPLHNAIADRLSEQTSTEEGPSIPSRRAEVFRRVLPRPRHSFAAAQRSIMPVSRHQRRVISPTSSSDLPKRRVAFQRAIISLFHNAHSRVGTSHSTHVPTHSSASSYQSKVELNSASSSLPSLDLVSPDTFLFSGPSLGSLSTSVDTSMSHLPCLTENSSDHHSLRHVRSKSFSVGNNFLTDAILEPSVEDSLFCNMSDMILASATPSESSLRTPDGKEQKLQPFPLRVCPEKPAGDNQPDTVVAPRSTLRLHGNQRKASQTINSSEEAVEGCLLPSKNAISHLIPHELLWLIYHYLGPQDFNSARHTCRTWIRASLDRRLLLKMLRRGGWENNTESDSDNKDARKRRNPSTKFIEEVQFLSWRLASEYAILPSRARKESLQSKSPFMDTSHIDFADLGNGAANNAHDLGSSKNICLLFNISVCGRYLLVARDTIIYVYELRKKDMVALTSVICPRRVLSMTMDASSGRDAVAALLECRMGMVCEIQHGSEWSVKSPADSREGKREDRSQSHSSVFMKESEAQPAIGVASSISYENGLDQSVDEPESVKVQSSNQVFTLQAINDARTHEQSFINHTWNISLRGLRKGSSNSTCWSPTHMCSETVPIEGSASTFYRHLCSEEDPPRSVSICPQRLCVAFGCSASIELHWIDALTGQSLSR
ncbi:hypothetical protein DM02DRAFT_657963 [Periconia macrospinosa]|uniref:F-box domain-containing protein n=1 Tax=Periconia macrospinosa TaxID=97972 RepID=A0A2V1DIN7_9PLEO|nr:hypothetical protein DM02DRAFT_657963 [Periconia macrospinosa]